MHLTQWSSAGYIATAREHSHLAMSADSSDCHNSGVGCSTTIRWVLAKDAAEHPTVHTSAPTRTPAAQNLHSAEAGKHSSKASLPSFLAKHLLQLQGSEWVCPKLQE